MGLPSTSSNTTYFGQVFENDAVSLMQKLVYKGGQVEEEFVETEYYKDLGCIGKEHHTVFFFALLQLL